MSTDKLKVVVDTNVLIASIGKISPSRWIFDKIITGDIILCVSNDIVLEYHEKLSQKTTHEIAQNLIGFLSTNVFVEKIATFYNFGLIQLDADDNKFVDCAIAANAFCIISNDKHFRILKEIDFPKVQIFNTEEFDKLFKSFIRE